MMALGVRWDADDGMGIVGWRGGWGIPHLILCRSKLGGRLTGRWLAGLSAGAAFLGKPPTPPPTHTHPPVDSRCSIQASLPLCLIAPCSPPPASTR